ncbi:MAG: DUF5076 domain-containing protein [Sphingomonadales bacterium]
MHEMPIPEAAFRDDSSIEVMRVWIADAGLHCSLNIGIYEGAGVDETTAWGIILADATKHIAMAMEARYGVGADTVMRQVIESYLSEIGDPTSDAHGDFVDGETTKPN